MNWTKVEITLTQHMADRDKRPTFVEIMAVMMMMVVMMVVMLVVIWW